MYRNSIGELAKEYSVELEFASDYNGIVPESSCCLKKFCEGYNKRLYENEKNIGNFLNDNRHKGIAWMFGNMVENIPGQLDPIAYEDGMRLSRIVSSKKNWNEIAILEFMVEVFSAVEFMHSLNIVHLGLSDTNNIFVVKDKNGKIHPKITNFTDCRKTDLDSIPSYV